MKTYFADTNLLLQCRLLQDLPWVEVSKGEDILLLIPRPVQEEIDKLKSDGNTRRARRARKVSSFLRNIILSGEEKLVIKETTPRVEVSFPPPLNHNQPLLGVLDLTNMDDRIIADVLAYRDMNPGGLVELLTHDTNAMLTAKRCGLQFTCIPDEWLLPPELDPRDKRIGALEEDLKQLKSNLPVIDASFQDDNDQSIDSFTIQVTTCQDFSADNVEEYVTTICEKHPMKKEFGEDVHSNIALRHFAPLTGLRFHPPSNEKIEKYQTKAYPEWVTRIREFITTFPARFEYPSRRAIIAFDISNIGTVPAENVIVDFTVVGGILFEPASTEAEKRISQSHELRFPHPPTPPQGLYQRDPIFRSISDQLTLGGSNAAVPSFGSFADVVPRGFPHVPPPRDRNEFYWKIQKPDDYADQWTFECEEFRHQGTSEVFELPIYVPRESEIEKGAIICTVSSKNLPKPFRLTLPITVKRIEAKAAQEILRFIEVKED